MAGFSKLEATFNCTELHTATILDDKSELTGINLIMYNDDIMYITTHDTHQTSTCIPT
jgi:hypothetical protein